ncbi:hypothetical protein TWF173_010262 [Orbilia oligospora]|nr:hypothetical protein TWF173_010262 [Orbilia oligospora]
MSGKDVKVLPSGGFETKSTCSVLGLTTKLASSSERKTRDEVKESKSQPPYIVSTANFVSEAVFTRVKMLCASQGIGRHPKECQVEWEYGSEFYPVLHTLNSPLHFLDLRHVEWAPMPLYESYIIWRLNFQQTAGIPSTSHILSSGGVPNGMIPCQAPLQLTTTPYRGTLLSRKTKGCFKCGGPYTHLRGSGTNKAIEILRPLGFCVLIDSELIIKNKDLRRRSKPRRLETPGIIALEIRRVRKPRYHHMVEYGRGANRTHKEKQDFRSNNMVSTLSCFQELILYTEVQPSGQDQGESCGSGYRYIKKWDSDGGSVERSRIAEELKYVVGRTGVQKMVLPLAVLLMDIES